MNVNDLKDKIKIFCEGTIIQSLYQCLEENYIPLDDKTILNLDKQNFIPSNIYGTRTVMISGSGIERDATLEELMNINKFCTKNGLFLFVNSGDKNSFIRGRYFLGSNGCIAGIPMSTDLRKEYNSIILSKKQALLP